MATWYLATNLPRPDGPHDTPDSPHPAADLSEVVRLYGIRHWIEQSYKQVKDELGWADFQVRSDTAIRRHQTLVNCAVSFYSDTFNAVDSHPFHVRTPVHAPCPSGAVSRRFGAGGWCSSCRLSCPSEAACREWRNGLSRR
jgi:hypothetical protein